MKKYLEKSNLFEEMYILTHNLRVQYFMAEESRQRKIESVSHTVCLIRKKREVNACSYSLLPFYAVYNAIIAMMVPQVGGFYNLVE